MGLAREFLARTLVALALAAAAAALGCWWSSLLVIKTAGTLDTLTQTSISHQITSQLEQLVPAEARQPQVTAAVNQVLHDPAVTQALASSVPIGSSLLSQKLSTLDPKLAPTLTSNHLSIDIGQHALAGLAKKLHAAASIALVIALVEAGVALVISPTRHLILRHLAFGAGLVGALALLLSWALPALVGRYTHGGTHHFLMDILSGAFPVRSVLLELAIGGGAVYLATHLFALLWNGRQIGSRDHPGGPLPQGRVV